MTRPTTIQSILTPVPREKCIWFYARVSHQDSADSGKGIEAQKQLCNTWFKFARESGKYPEHRLGAGGQRYRGKELEEGLGPFFIDEAVSAFKVRFMARQAGLSLWGRLRPGDVLVIPYLDRAFRNMSDWITTMTEFERRKVEVVFLNPSVDMSNIWGRAMAHIFAVFAEVDSALKSQRCTEVANLPATKARLRHSGYKRVKNANPIADFWIRFVAWELIRPWKERIGGRKIFQHKGPVCLELLEKLQAHHEGREPYKLLDDRRFWTEMRFKFAAKGRVAEILENVDESAHEAVWREIMKYRLEAAEALGLEVLPAVMREQVLEYRKNNP